MTVQPIFILFAPQLGENIGAVARAMSNFGLHDLRIIAPRDGWPNPAASAMAAGGIDIINHAKVYDTLTESLHDVTHLYATTARNRALGKPVFSPKELVGRIATISANASQNAGKAAILFGPERAGLANEEIALADAVVTIPVDASNPSLNLAQASVVLAYEWFASHGQVPCAAELGAAQESPLASKQEIAGMLEHLKNVTDAVGYVREANKEEQMWLHLRHIFNRMQPTLQEIRTLRGLIRSILRHVTPRK